MGFVDATAGSASNKVVLTHLTWNNAITKPSAADQRRALNASGHKIGYLTATERTVAANRAQLLDSQLDRLVLMIENTGSTEGDTVDVKILAGPDQATSSLGITSIGALDVTVPHATTMFFGPFEAGRFVQDDGTVHVDITLNASGAGYITAYLVPKPQNVAQS